MLGLPDQAGEHVLGIRDGVDLRPDPGEGGAVANPGSPSKRQWPR
ncbi:hypothetical protein [Pseudonocardia sp.]|jgi:hypothetical protein|nr:hypothetical protein [Pseudonocardia sp.]